MPWGTVNLDPSIAENNDHALSTWCYRQIELVEADRVSLWSTNPMGMLIGRPVPRSMLNVEVLSRDADWRIAPSGEKYFIAGVIAHATADQSDTHRFALQIYYNAPLAINAPVDERFNGNSKYWSLFMPVDARVTDVNQIRVGQIYALIDRLTGWGGAPDLTSYRTFTIKLGTNPLGIYPVPVPWLCTCAFKQQQGWIK